MSADNVSIEAVDKVVHALFTIIAEKDSKIRDLEAEITGPGSRNGLQLRRANSELQNKIQAILDLCEEQEHRAGEFKANADDIVVHVDEIRRILT